MVFYSNRDFRDNKKCVKLETKDKFQIRIEFDVLLRSKVIQHMCAVCDSTDKETVLPMHGINHDILLKILLWLEFHKDDEEPSWVKEKEEPDDIERKIHCWDKEFLRENLVTVKAIMVGADYLDLPWLVKLCSRKLRIRGSSQLLLHVLSSIAPID